MTTLVYVPAEHSYALIVRLMAYGAVVRYDDGIDEMLGEEDYIVVKGEE